MEKGVPENGREYMACGGVGDRVDDGASCSDQYYFIDCDCLFPAAQTADRVDMAACTVFYSDRRVCAVSADRAGFQEEPYVQDEGH